MSDAQRKNAESIARDQKVAPRTLQRFLESIVRDEQMLRDRCQQIIATEHAQAGESHRQTRRKRLAELGIDPDKIKSVPPKHPKI